MIGKWGARREDACDGGEDGERASGMVVGYGDPKSVVGDARRSPTNAPSQPTVRPPLLLCVSMTRDTEEK